MATFLELDDFPSILEMQDASRRAGLAKRLYSDFDANNLNRDEALVALIVFNGIVHDEDVAVRHEFARFVAPSVKLPRELAIAIALDDENRVAMPFLRFGLALSDEFLVDVVGAGDALAQGAIAQRADMSVALMAAIIEVGCRDAILRLLRNENISVSSTGLIKLSRRFDGDDEVANLLLVAPEVPSSFVEDRIHVISNRLKTFVDFSGWMAPDAADKAVENAVEHSLVEFAVGRAGQELAPFFDKWSDEGRVTHGFAMRAACYGALPLLGFALGRGSGLPPRRVVALWSDEKGYGQQSLVAAAGYSDEEGGFILKAYERFAPSQKGAATHLRPGHEWRIMVAEGIEAALTTPSLSAGFAEFLEGIARDVGIDLTGSNQSDRFANQTERAAA